MSLPRGTVRIDHGRQRDVGSRVPSEHGQENGLRQTRETMPLRTASGAEMKQHGRSGRWGP